MAIATVCSIHINFGQKVLFQAKFKKAEYDGAYNFFLLYGTVIKLSFKIGSTKEIQKNTAVSKRYIRKKEGWKPCY